MEENINHLLSILDGINDDSGNVPWDWQGDFHQDRVNFFLYLTGWIGVICDW